MTTVVGTGPISYPKQPAGSPWAKDESPNLAIRWKSENPCVNELRLRRHPEPRYLHHRWRSLAVV